MFSDILSLLKKFHLEALWIEKYYKILHWNFKSVKLSSSSVDLNTKQMFQNKDTECPKQWG